MTSKFPILCINGGSILQIRTKVPNCVRVSSLLCLTYVLFKLNNVNQMQQYVFSEDARFHYGSSYSKSGLYF